MRKKYFERVKKAVQAARTALLLLGIAVIGSLISWGIWAIIASSLGIIHW